MSADTSGRILLIDDEPAVLAYLREALITRGQSVTATESAEAALEQLERAEFDVVVTDLQLDQIDGLELCARLHQRRPGVPVIVITGHASVDTAIGALRAGAYDFIAKPIQADDLAFTVARAIDHSRLEAEVRLLRQAVSSLERQRTMIGKSPAITRVLRRIDRTAPTETGVLITGESGTGKELVAQAIHEGSARSKGPFVAVDCASIPATVLESELFGHVRGAFTDAKSERRGLFALADGGTLFLDEIGEMPLEMQAKLLRALQERKIRPVGGNTQIPFDARIVAATNRDIEAEAEEGRFRRDLYYRINVVHIELPPLRARGNDVLLLAQYFLQEAARRNNKRVDGLTREAAEKLRAYHWPGNVRELANCIEGAVALAEHDKLTVEDLPEPVRDHTPATLVSTSNDPDALVSLEELERRYVRRVYDAVGGNKTRAARILGVERRTLYRKLRRYDII